MFICSDLLSWCALPFLNLCFWDRVSQSKPQQYWSCPFSTDQKQGQGKGVSRSWELSRHITLFWKNCIPCKVLHISTDGLRRELEPQSWIFLPSIKLMSWRANKAPSLLHILYLGMRFETSILIFPMSRACVYTKTSSIVYFICSGH